MQKEKHFASAIGFGLIALLAIVLLHQPWISLHKLLIGPRVLTFVEMSLMKLLVGALTSLVIIALCAIIVRKLTFTGIAAAIAVQVVWLEFEWGFSIGAVDAGELSVRFAEEVGILVSGAVATCFVLLRKSSLSGEDDHRT